MKNTNQNSLARLLERLDNIYGVSGDETLVGKVLQEEMQGLYDEFYEDALGNHVFVRTGKNRGKKVMLCAHMDEIGFVVNYIEDNGMLRFVPVGFHDDRMAINQDMVIFTQNGTVRGITGCKPAHILTHEEQEKTIKIADLFVDIGTTSRKETEALGVCIGNYVCFNRKGYFLNNSKIYSGKSVDNRSGCAVLVEVMRRIKNMDIKPTVYAVGTVQEEVGMRGAGPAAHKIKPDLVLALDVTLAGGIPGIELRQCSIEMGKGPAIKFYDWDPIYGMVGNNVPKKLTDRLVAVAENSGTPYQRDVLMGGGTDGWSAALSGDGILSGVISIPSQYIHTAVGTVHLDDIENTVNLVIEYLKEYVSL